MVAICSPRKIVIEQESIKLFPGWRIARSVIKHQKPDTQVIRLLLIARATLVKHASMVRLSHSNRFQQYRSVCGARWISALPAQTVCDET